MSGCQRNSAKLPGGRKKAVTLNAFGFLPHPLSEKLVQIHLKGKPLVSAATGPDLHSLFSGLAAELTAAGWTTRSPNSLCWTLLFRNHPTDSQRLVESLQKSHCEHFFWKVRLQTDREEKLGSQNLKKPQCNRTKSCRLLEMCPAAWCSLHSLQAAEVELL